MLYKLFRQHRPWLSLSVLYLVLSGCATELPVTVAQPDVSGTLAVGRVVTIITGESQRIYAPELRSFEVINTQSQERFRVDVQSADGYFLFSIPPGHYDLSRVQISEGPFLSMAQLSASFALKPDVMTFLGTWHFGVDSPKYGRHVVVSMTYDEQGQERARQFVTHTYPTFNERSPVMSVLEPSYEEARLYEVMPYPRILGYFRRHWW
ncbi:MAG: hypothetical protein ACREJN_17145 [Nitrospiraceae bacterium]